MRCKNCGDQKYMEKGVCSWCMKVDLKYRALHTDIAMAMGLTDEPIEEKLNFLNVVKYG